MNDNEHYLFLALELFIAIRVMCGTKRLNPFFRLHGASALLNKYVMGCDQITSQLTFSLVSL